MLLARGLRSTRPAVCRRALLGSPRHFDVGARAKELGCSLTKKELKAVVREADAAVDGDKKLTEAEYRTLVDEHAHLCAEREVLNDFIVKSDDKSFGQRLLNYMDYGGTALFSLVGTQLAGEAGMHIVGCTWVGCVAGMGGGTLNNVLFGNTRGGVFWMRDPTFFVVAVVASVCTFFGWPLAERELAKYEFAQLRAAACADGAGDTVDFERFAAALPALPEFHERLRSTISRLAGDEALDAQGLWAWLVRGEDALTLQHIQRLARAQIKDSEFLYYLDSMALSAFAVLGAQGAITRGMPLPICAVAGITICFGGILRDLLCNRDIALGSESYAGAMGAASASYVGLRQLVLAGVLIPLEVRILASAAVCFGIRMIALYDGPGDKLLKPMHDKALDV
ncbi:hypothetical protein M885DRAFT_144139 [Pelagophyceae sp. CCMP2097]|nr:hypothetical protein M885DRAFT_144139 [Pelagophyceae sp. CCMP2097]|mmetsp:Transcript_10190/g.33734  ORF Transcript_10190/g.33734 Transcript_10190/m.33734 type:complete len:396 (+) Transcript_10190:196-1383(+)